MLKPIAIVLVTLLMALFVAVPAPKAAGGDVKTYLNAPVWYLQYEVSLKASHQDTRTPAEGGKYTTAMSLDRFFSGGYTFDTRMQGPGLSTNRGMENAEKMTQAEMMKATQAMLARMDNVAFWMETPVDMGDDVAAAGKKKIDASMVPARVDYTKVMVREDLRNELNQLFKETTRTTASGSASVYPPGSLMFEIDTTAGEYLLSLPWNFSDMSTEANAVKMESVVRTEVQGEAPLEERTASEMSIDSLPEDLVVEDPSAQAGGSLVVGGKLDPAAGKVSGENTVKVHFKDGVDTVPGTLVFRYTLTMTPPAKKAPGK